MTTLAAVGQQQHVTSLIERCLSSCHIEGESDEAIWVHRETLDIFLNAVRGEAPPSILNPSPLRTSTSSWVV